MKHDRGSMSVEAVLLAPVLVVLALFVVHLGRLGSAQTRLIAAADHAARAASQVHPRMMSATGQHTASQNMMQNGLRCESFDVQVTVVEDTDPNVVEVSISCLLDRRGLELLGPTPRRLSASSSEVVDRWRVDS